ncbi:MAG: DUF4080 domain-containing protein [Clostridia bacterium]|nr:DUF4080 domain-containing protein [Clostridia bacterium]
MREKFNVVISTLNSKYIHSSLAPWCLFAGIGVFGIDEICAKVVEGTVNEDIGGVAERIVKQSPNVVGLGCYIWNIEKIKQLVKLIKSSLPDCIIVLGGPEVSYNAENVLKSNSEVDYIISGEGELPFALLMNCLCKGDDVSKVPGLCYLNEGKALISKPYIHVKQPPSPYTEEYFAALNGRIAYLESSRGCPYSCAFCLSGRCGNARFFDIDRAEGEIIKLANSGAKTVKFVDRTFNANKNRADRIFKFIIDNYGENIPKGVCFHFEIAGDILDDGTISLLSTAPKGLIQLEIGLQSFNEKTLKAINRKTNVEKLKSNIQKLIENGNMHIHIDLIAGLPFEDMDSLKQSFNIAFKLNPNMLQFGFLKLLHGADMREKAEEYPCTYNPAPPYEVISTPWLSADEIKGLHQFEDALERLYNSGRFRRTVNYLLQASGKLPFDLFYDFATKTQINYNIPLDHYVTKVYEHFAAEPYVDKSVLRDEMVCDRLSTNSSGVLPKVLQVEDKLLKKVKAYLTQQYPQGEIKRSVAILYSKDRAVYVDYDKKDPVTEEYALKLVDNCWLQ